MEIKVNLEPIGEYSTGGGCREVSAIITIDSTYSRRLQREHTVYEVMGAIFGYVIPHELLEDAAGILNDALDQLEAERERISRGIDEDVIRPPGDEVTS